MRYSFIVYNRIFLFVFIYRKLIPFLCLKISHSRPIKVTFSKLNEQFKSKFKAYIVHMFNYVKMNKIAVKTILGTKCYSSSANVYF